MIRIRSALTRFHREERGDGAFAALVFLLVMLAGMATIVYAGRAVQMAGAMQAAAEDGARSGTLEQFTELAVTASQDTMVESLQGRSVPCQNLQMSVTAPGDPASPGALERGGWVQMDATCELLLRDIGWFDAIPGSVTVTVSARERVDVYRGI